MFNPDQKIATHPVSSAIDRIYVVTTVSYRYFCAECNNSLK